MAETKSTDEAPTFPTKRKPEFRVEDQEDHSNNKNPKLEKPVDHDSLEEKPQNQTLVSSGNNKLEPEEDDEEGEYEGEEEEDEDDGDEDEDEDEAEVNGDTEVDRKGKGIMKDDKGKGKAIAVEDSSDDEDSGDGGSESGDSDLSDDPLAEVDLDNILPSRTRRKAVQPGAYIANDRGADDDDSDDSDA
ncbi:transcription initiation factor TFIID subunit 11 [Tripterygium wilfordii]|uniref:Transcription initiation factor TFIID subunit 11 n=1 Tax=Tripterygium wilfordii TaxID=458696 RepID=A0A7J7CRU6_TRIWF|nr:prothymosin alpha-like [Tripterygium wilfordii]XP_038722778.1 prothymosin alpha-like [Tripterygium wilfordii]KAF5736825.1 transcription initiation factor TFIID subunit 11 [Tripterygium wilfordii]